MTAEKNRQILLGKARRPTLQHPPSGVGLSLPHGHFPAPAEAFPVRFHAFRPEAGDTLLQRLRDPSLFLLDRNRLVPNLQVVGIAFPSIPSR